MIFSRGMRDKISKYITVDAEICIHMSVDGAAVYDFCCFGVDGSGKLSDDRYMIFYNQPASPHHEITLNNQLSLPSQGSAAEFRVSLAKLPPAVEKLVFTANIDGDGTMGEILKHRIALSQNGQEAISMELSGSDFREEKAIISIELYRKDEWRIAAVANGFNGGLSALLKEFGGTESDAPAAQAPAPVPASPQMSSEDRLTQKMMGKINLSKDKVNLEKHVVNLSKCAAGLSRENGIDFGSLRAQVAVILDYSASMRSLYSNGTVQRTVTRLVPLGLAFDDNGSIDVYLFQNDYRKMTDLNLSNYENYVTDVIQRSGYSMGGTNYAPVLTAVIGGDSRRGLFGSGRKAEAIVNGEIPTFILFITDGENSDRAATTQIIRKSSQMNVFIQFIGIGKEKFKYLEKLDDLSGRVRDNTGFSKMQSLDDAPDEELYRNVLGQFSNWLRGLQ